MFTGILQRFLILETFIVVALCCSCRRESTLTHFCSNEFALKVNVREHLQRKGASAFLIRVLDVYQGNIEKFNFRNRSGILRMSVLCADHLALGKTYLIMGENHYGNLRTNMCSGNKLWRRVTSRVRKGLEGQYKEKCDDLDNANVY